MDIIFLVLNILLEMNRVKEGSCLVNTERPFHVVECSHQFAAFFGYSADELQYRSLRCLNGAELTAHDLEDLIRSIRSHEHERCEVSATKKDGSRIRAMVVLSAQMIRKDTPYHCVPTALVSLCEPYEYINNDNASSCEYDLHDTDLEVLNHKTLSNQGCGTLVHALQSNVSDHTQFDCRPDLVQDRESLRSSISKASCQVDTCLSTLP